MFSRIFAAGVFSFAISGINKACSKRHTAIFVSLHSSLSITMDSSAPTDRDEISCIMLVTVMKHCDEWISGKEAFKWTFGIIRKATKDADTFFEGDLQQVAPLRASVSGRKFKSHFVGVPDQLMSSVIIPAFEKEGQVAKLSKDQEELDKAQALSKAGDVSKRAQAIGDVAGVNSTIERSLPHMLS
jgi:hypothetical protein